MLRHAREAVSEAVHTAEDKAKWAVQHTKGRFSSKCVCVIELHFRFFGGWHGGHQGGSMLQTAGVAGQKTTLRRLQQGGRSLDESSHHKRSMLPSHG